MKKVTKTIRAAFERRQPCKVGNTHTDGNAVYLHGNKIVERRDNGVYVSNAGWLSVTTKERLSAFCDVYQRNFNWFINGNIYEGGWVRVAD